MARNSARPTSPSSWRPSRPPLELREVVDTGPWDHVYLVDGFEDVTTVADVTTVRVNRFVDGQTIILETHWKLAGDQYTWFADCGDVLGTG